MNGIKNVIVLIGLVLLITLNCGNKNPSENSSLVTSTITDIDGNVYKTVKIGDQWWMAENLKVTHYRNDDPIPYVLGDKAWEELITGAYCKYIENSKSFPDYGYLYNGYAVADPRGIAPEGWHVPSHEDWIILEMCLGMKEDGIHDAGARGTDEGGKLKEAGQAHWDSPNVEATNSSGFTALPGGYRSTRGNFINLNQIGIFQTSSDSTDWCTWSRMLSTHRSDITLNCEDKRIGMSVRLVKD